MDYKIFREWAVARGWLILNEYPPKLATIPALESGGGSALWLTPSGGRVALLIDDQGQVVILAGG